MVIGDIVIVVVMYVVFGYEVLVIYVVFGVIGGSIFFVVLYFGQVQCVVSVDDVFDCQIEFGWVDVVVIDEGQYVWGYGVMKMVSCLYWVQIVVVGKGGEDVLFGCVVNFGIGVGKWVKMLRKVYLVCDVV